MFSRTSFTNAPMSVAISLCTPVTPMDDAMHTSFAQVMNTMGTDTTFRSSFTISNILSVVTPPMSARVGGMDHRVLGGGIGKGD